MMRHFLPRAVGAFDSFEKLGFGQERRIDQPRQALRTTLPNRLRGWPSCDHYLAGYYFAAQPQAAHLQQVHGEHVQDGPHLQHGQVVASGLAWVDALAWTWFISYSTVSGRNAALEG